MKTVKEVSKITGVSIRTLRYYDEIGLLKPAQLSDAGYRLYDDKALERLQLILFFRELELSLADIRELLENPDYDREKLLRTQKTLLENKRNRLSGMIELITDVMEGVNTMNFEAFQDTDIKRILDHLEENLSEEALQKLINQYGSLEEYRAAYAHSLKDEKVNADLLKWYGGKDKAVEASLNGIKDIGDYQRENDDIYACFGHFVGTEELEEENNLVARLAECYKGMFHLDNARAMLLDLAAEYLENETLSEANDAIYGKGVSELMARAIRRYYGVS